MDLKIIKNNNLFFFRFLSLLASDNVITLKTCAGWYELTFKKFADFAVDLMWFTLLNPFTSELFILCKISKNSSSFPSSTVETSSNCKLK